MTSDQYTIEEKMFPVSDGHILYVQLWGNPHAAETILFLHGGPGSGCSDSHKELFDPMRHRVVFFDQRGSGRSLPHGSLTNNTTDALIEDINAIMASFAVQDFSITGGSWGSCLALAYALKYPDRVRRMVLRGIFTGRASEIEFMEKGTFRFIFPEVWEAFVTSVPQEFRDDPRKYLMPRVLGDDAAAAKEAAFAYSKLEGALLSLDDRFTAENFAEFDPASTIIECHYTANACFLPEGYIMENADKLRMPIRLVQGRYDVVCPPYTAYELSQVLPDVQLRWTVAGHSGRDRGNWDVVRAFIAA